MSLLRVLFFLLLAANLVLYAWGQGIFGEQDQGREPERISNQLAPEKLRVLGARPASEAAAVSPVACRTIDGLSADEARELKTPSGGVLAGLQVTVKPLEPPARYWVHLAPQASRQAAARQVAELKRLGIAEPSLVEPEPNRFAVSLALFEDRAAASEYVRALASRGFQSPVEITLRDQDSARAQVIVRGSAELVAGRLPALAARFPAARIADCPPERRP